MNKISKETQAQALQIAKATQQPKQTKEQTKLIAKGIEKGIAEYKKQQRKKAREQDKQRKAKLKKATDTTNQDVITATDNKNTINHYLPWLLLMISWLGFSIFLFI